MKNLLKLLAIFAILSTLSFAEEVEISDEPVVNCKSEYETCVSDCKNANEDEAGLKECLVICEDDFEKCENATKTENNE